MNILLVGKPIPRIKIDEGVPATIYIHALAKELVAMGHDVDVACSYMPNTKLRDYGVMQIGSLSLLKWLPQNVYELWYAFKLGRAIKTLHKNYDIVHFLEAPAPAFFSLLSNKKRSVPFIFSTGRPIDNNLMWHSQGTPFFTRFLSDFMHSYVFRHADKVLTSSKALKTSLVIYCNPNLGKLNALPFISAMPERFYPQPKDKALMQSLGINKHDQVVLCLGEVAPYKNQLTLVKAIAQLIPNFPNLKVLIVGGLNKNYHKTILGYINSNFIESHFIFTGYIKEHRDLVKYHNLADVFALVSVAEGNLPQTVLDAMCCQKPCLVSELPQNREWAREAVATCNPYDVDDVALKLKWLLNNDNMRERLSDNGYRKVLAQHPPRVIAEYTIKVYESIT
jgi:glycosyltransferase involved in cell wall biosynthesis